MDVVTSSQASSASAEITSAKPRSLICSRASYRCSSSSPCALASRSPAHAQSTIPPRGAARVRGRYPEAYRCRMVTGCDRDGCAEETATVARRRPPLAISGILLTPAATKRGVEAADGRRPARQPWNPQSSGEPPARRTPACRSCRTRRDGSDRVVPPIALARRRGGRRGGRHRGRRRIGGVQLRPADARDLAQRHVAPRDRGGAVHRRRRRPDQHPGGVSRGRRTDRGAQPTRVIPASAADVPRPRARRDSRVRRFSESEPGLRDGERLKSGRVCAAARLVGFSAESESERPAPS